MQMTRPPRDARREAATAAWPTAARPTANGVAAWVTLALIVLTLSPLAYVVLRIGNAAPISYNEGWNTYHTARLLAGEPLYPRLGDALPLTPLNYPPLSFLLVGALSPLFGSILLTGRVVSLAALLTVAGLIAAIVYRETADRVASLAAAVLWLGLLVTLALPWAGAEEPQLLGHAVALTALYLALRWLDDLSPRHVVGLALLCVLVLGVKHILIAVPLVIAAMLARTDRRALGVFVGSLAALGGLFLGGWWLATGGAFVAHVIDLGRGGSLTRTLGEVASLAGGQLGVVMLLPALVIARHVPRRWPLVYLGLGLGLGLLWSHGDGVSKNAWFDLFIAAAIVFGLFLSMLPRLTGRRRRVAHVVAILVLLPLAWGYVLRPLSGDVGASLPQHEAAYLRDVQRLRGFDGPALYEDILLGHDAGQAWLVDPFITAQFILGGRVAEDTLVKPIREQRFAIIVFDTDLDQRLRRLDPATENDTTPHATADERWTDATLRAVAANYVHLDTDGAHYFYVPRQRIAASPGSD